MTIIMSLAKILPKYFIPTTWTCFACLEILCPFSFVTYRLWSWAHYHGFCLPTFSWSSCRWIECFKYFQLWDISLEGLRFAFGLFISPTTIKPFCLDVFVLFILYIAKNMSEHCGNQCQVISLLVSGYITAECICSCVFLKNYRHLAAIWWNICALYSGSFLDACFKSKSWLPPVSLGWFQDILELVHCRPYII